MDKLDQDRLNKLFYFDKNTKELKRKIKTGNSTHVDDVVGTNNGKGRLKVEISGKSHYLSRVIWTMFNGDIPKKMQVDHINKVRNDNRPCNLRLLTNVENNKNKTKSKKNKSGVTGVYATKNNRFIASIRVDWKLIHIGVFQTISEAAKARKRAEIKYGFYEGHGT